MIYIYIYICHELIVGNRCPFFNIIDYFFNFSVAYGILQLKWLIYFKIEGFTFNSANLLVTMNRRIFVSLKL